MSEMQFPPSDKPVAGERPPLTVIPVQHAQPGRPRPPSAVGIIFRGFFFLVLMGSVILNFILMALVLIRLPEDGGSAGLYERYHSGDKKSLNKIAIIKMDGVIMEGMTSFAQKQIEDAVRDDHVKAVVLRINSPGGSITASDDLHRRLKELRDGTTPGIGTGVKKPIVVSMGALTASGGYYIAMPAEHIVAEPTTITGSIGVYASFPNISGLAKKYGFGMEVIKAGEVKDSGSMFKEMKPEERQLWQDMVNHAFDQFLGIVEDGRPQLKGKLREDIPEETKDVTVTEEDGKEKTVHCTRKRADGGIFTADKAKAYGLVDQIGYLEDAVAEAAKRANLKDYRAVKYERPPTLMDVLMKGQSSSGTKLDASRLAEAATPRLWYLAPQSELAGILSSLGRE
jgi:protease-4